MTWRDILLCVSVLVSIPMSVFASSAAWHFFELNEKDEKEIARLKLKCGETDVYDRWKD